jgi:FkbM family methyltransferase
MENVGESNLRNSEFKNKFTREKLLQLLIGKDNPIIFDIGAHEGQSILFFSKIFPNASLYSFEPDPHSFQILSNISVPNLKLENIALSDNIGETSFYRNNISHTNSLFKVNQNSKDSISILNAKSENNESFFEGLNNEIKVKTTTLDVYTKINKINIIDLLKIDVQGAEVKVLNGAISTLETTKCVILEISFYDYYETQTSFMDIEKILSPMAFKLYSISEISNNPMNGRTDWVEVIYLKQ